MNWNDFSRFYDREFELFCQQQQKDVELWTGLAEIYGDPLLELACGSGRITLPLAEKGWQLTAIDNSEKMLEILRTRIEKHHKITVLKSSMTAFELKNKYNFAFISYSSFQQLLTREEQLRCLKKIHQHLNDEGVLGLDIGTKISSGKDHTEFQHLYTADFPQNDSTVSMFTSFHTDRIKKIRYWKDKYIEVFKNGSQQIFYNKTALVEIKQEAMIELCRETGFEIIEIYGSFEWDELSENSNNAIYLLRKRNT